MVCRYGDRNPGAHHLRGGAQEGCAIWPGICQLPGRAGDDPAVGQPAGALIMTLPGLVSKALQTRFGDQTLRYAYPLNSWMIEQSTDPNEA